MTFNTRVTLQSPREARTCFLVFSSSSLLFFLVSFLKFLRFSFLSFSFLFLRWPGGWLVAVYAQLAGRLLAGCLLLAECRFFLGLLVGWVLLIRCC
jgi:hypothetical protein